MPQKLDVRGYTRFGERIGYRKCLIIKGPRRGVNLIRGWAKEDLPGRTLNHDGCETATPTAAPTASPTGSPTPSPTSEKIGKLRQKVRDCKRSNLESNQGAQGQVKATKTT